jgi:4-hydroxybenzoyl-CoA thioesterase
MMFSTPIQIRFAHCDPAGIVFYPRYFEMINGVVEDWCEQGLGRSFKQLHQVRGIGLPTVHLTTDFLQASELGESLTAELTVSKIGGASVTLQVCLKSAQGEMRLKAELVLVTMDLKLRKAIAIPEDIRLRMQNYCAA